MGVLNRPAGNRSKLSKIINKGTSVNTNKPIGLLNKLPGSGAILGKRDIMNILLCIWINQMKTPRAYIYIFICHL